MILNDSCPVVAEAADSFDTEDITVVVVVAVVVDDFETANHGPYFHFL